MKSILKFELIFELIVDMLMTLSYNLEVLKNNLKI